MEQNKKLDELTSIRLFRSEKTKINKITGKAKGEDGLKKYESESHFIRCAIMNQIEDDKEYLNERGRSLK